LVNLNYWPNLGYVNIKAMKYYHYIIIDDEIAEFRGEVQTIPVDFIEYQVTMTGERVFYKSSNGILKEIIAEGGNADSAERRANEFLSALNVNLSLGMP
jgi:hypothetical protein